MKNKRLLLNLLAVFAGIAVLTLSATGTFNNRGELSNTPESEGYYAAVEYLATLRNNQITGTIDPADVLRAREMSMKSLGSGMQIDWEVAGPDNFAGRTRAILYDKSDSQFNTIYAGSTSGGLWKSTTGGILWDPVPGSNHIMNITCMVQDDDGRIYIGTGEAFNVFRFAAYPGFMGSGIHVFSTENEVFEVLESTIPSANDSTSVWAYINKIAINPLNQQQIYIATNSGLKYSNNRGGAWVHATDTASNILSHPSTDVKIGADGITVATVNNLVYISDDGNPGNFINYSTGVNQERLPFSGINRTEVAIAPSNPDVIYVVATRGTPNLGQLENVYLSINRGDTWRIVGPGGSDFFSVFGSDNVGTYANTIIVHPTNPDVVLIGGKNMWQGVKFQDEGYYAWYNKAGIGNAPYFGNSNHHIYAFKPDNPNTVIIGTDRGIYRSTNGLESFQNMNKNFYTEKCYSVSFNSGKRIFTGTQSNGVLFISESGNTSGHAERIDFDLQPALRGLGGGHVAMSLINQNALIWARTIPTTTTAQPVPLFRSDDLGATLALAAFTPASTTLSNFLPPVLFWESFNYTQSRDSVIYHATDTIPADSVVWVRSNNSRYPFRYTMPHTLNEGDSILVQDTIASRLFYGLRRTSLNYEVYMTKHAVQFTRAAEWYKILETAGIPQCFGISNDGNYLWVGTRNGKVYRLGNLNNAYNSNTAVVGSEGYAIEASLVADYTNRIVTSISIDPNNNDHVIVTLGNYGNETYVYYSENATGTNPVLSSVQGELPRMPVYSSLIVRNTKAATPDPISKVVLLGTERGIFSTSDITSPDPVWAKETVNMGDVAVLQLRQQLINKPAVSVPIDSVNFEVFPGVDNYGKIYAATFGRGIYKTTHFSVVGTNELPEISKLSQTRLHIYPNPASQILFIGYNGSTVAPVEVNIIDLSGRSVKQQSFGILSSGQQTLQMDISSLRNGVYLVQLISGDQVLSNKLIVR